MLFGENMVSARAFVAGHKEGHVCLRLGKAEEARGNHHSCKPGVSAGLATVAAVSQVVAERPSSRQCCEGTRPSEVVAHMGMAVGMMMAPACVVAVAMRTTCWQQGILSGRAVVIVVSKQVGSPQAFIPRSSCCQVSHPSSRAKVKVKVE
jgi:predicted cobalt transporter CbtA